MNAKQLLAVAAFAVVGSSAFATEAEQFVPQTGSLTRAEVRAELSRAQAAGDVVAIGETYGGVVAVAKATPKFDTAKVARSRDEVRAEARAAARSNDFNALYVGG